MIHRVQEEVLVYLPEQKKLWTGLPRQGRPVL